MVMMDGLIVKCFNRFVILSQDQLLIVKRTLHGNSETKIPRLQLKLMHNSKTAVEFKGSWLKQGKLSFADRNLVNLFITTELKTWSRDLNTILILDKCLFEL